MSAAIAPLKGSIRQLDRPAEPDERVTPEQAQDPERMSRIVQGLLNDVATLKRAWTPRRIDFEDVAVDGTGSTLYRFPHGFGGRVRWWVVDWSGAASVAGLMRDEDATDDNTLVLVSWIAGTVTVRVEEAG